MTESIVTTHVDVDSLHRMITLLRECTCSRLQGLDDELLLRVSADEPHSILWHLGHITFASDSFVQRACREPSPLPAYFATAFAPGTSPAQWTEVPPIAEVKRLFREQPTRIRKALRQRRFSAAYDSVEITPGFAIRDVGEALVFNVAHEGFHFAAVTNLLVKMHIQV